MRQRGREGPERRTVVARALSSAFFCAVLGLTSGCVTERVWSWAGEGKYSFIPSPVTSLGLLREESHPDRLFFRVAATTASGEDDPGEVYVLRVPLDWKARRLVVVPDDIQPGDLQLSDLLEAKTTAPPPDATVALLTPIPLRAAASFPALDTAPYAYIEGPPGILFIYAADDERGRWIRLSSVITGRVISTPPSKFNYALAAIATPVTASADLVGIVVYAVLWPLWTSLEIGYGDGDAAYRQDGGYEPGRTGSELEHRPAVPEKETSP